MRLLRANNQQWCSFTTACSPSFIPGVTVSAGQCGWRCQRLVSDRFASVQNIPSNPLLLFLSAFENPTEEKTTETEARWQHTTQTGRKLALLQARCENSRLAIFWFQIHGLHCNHQGTSNEKPKKGHV